MKESFCFVLNCIEVEGDLPLNLIEGFRFQKATPEQIADIKERLSAVFRVFLLHSARYEQEMVLVTHEPGHTSGESRMLPPERWRYWVVVFDRDEGELQRLAISSSLLKNDLDFGLVFTPFANSYGWSYGAELIHYGQPCPFNVPPPIVKTDELKEVGTIYDMITAAQMSAPTLYQTIRRFWSLKALATDPHFLFVGYCSILEALITHAPKLTEPLDSITHQIKTKMNLLEKRFERTLDYSSFAKDVSHEKIWGLLYQYRSTVAHGDEPNFKKKLKALRDSSAAVAFLHDAVKLTIRFALQDPQFVDDLKRC